MGAYNIVLLIMLVLTLFIMMTGAVQMSVVKRYRGWYVDVVDGFYDGTFETSVPDRILCEGLCLSKPFCCGVTYNTGDLSCILYQNRSVLVYNGDMENEVTIIRQQPVTVIRVNSIRDLTEWTLQVATSTCTELDLQIMTKSELGAEDYNSHKCGYVQDGSTVQATRSGTESCTLSHASTFCSDTQSLLAG